MKVDIDQLKAKINTLLLENFPAEEAEKITDYLMWAEMTGNSTQGLLKLTGTEPLQNIKATSEIKVIREKKLSQLIDAGANPAPYVSQIATDTVISKAQEHGFGIVGVNNIHSSNGAQGYYADKIAKHDLIGIVLARSSAAAAGFGGKTPVFGTNPIAFSFPTLDRPLVFDMATSAMTWYGLVLAKAKGESIPENVAIDKNGQPTTDPAEAMQGALLSFDKSYKGSGLGMVIEVLGGPLVGATFGQVEGDWGSLFIAIDPDLLIDVGDFKIACSELIIKIRSAAPINQNTPIRIPGESANQKLTECEQSGLIEVDEKLLSQLDLF